ncbi:hypothetical protein YC2023_020799 [Brassica napus]
MAKILKRYEIQHADELNTVINGPPNPNLPIRFLWQDLAEKGRNYLSHEELLEIVQCKLEEAKSDNISVESLISLEEQFKSALSITRARKAELMMELVKTLQEKVNALVFYSISWPLKTCLKTDGVVMLFKQEKLLREENKVLASQLPKMEKNRFLEAEDERAISLAKSFGNNTPETLSLLK